MDDRRGTSVGFIGAGRLGAALAAGLAKAGYRVRAVASANRESARTLAGQIGPGVEAAEDANRVAALCDVVFLTVPDSSVGPACAAVRWQPRHVAVHCSGALGLDALARAAAGGAAAACFHPLQTFPSRVPEPGRFEGVFCGIESSEPAGALLEHMANDLGARPFRLEGVDRALYHAAAVMASNLVVALMGSATRLWELAGLEASSGRQALSPLLLAAARNISQLDLAKALTGPVARGDVATVERHLAALEADPELAKVYRLLSAELLRLALGHDATTLARLRELLEG